MKTNQFENFFKGIGEWPPEDQLKTMELDQFLGELSETILSAGYKLNEIASKREPKPMTITVHPDTNPNNKDIHVTHYDENGLSTERYYTKADFKEICKNSSENIERERKQLIRGTGVYMSSDYFTQVFDEDFIESGCDWDDYYKKWLVKQVAENNLIAICNKPKPLYILKDDALDNDWIGEDEADNGRDAILKCIFDLEHLNNEHQKKYDDLSFQMGMIFHQVNDGLKLANASELYESGIEIDD